MTDAPLTPDARRAAAGLVALLLETDLSLEQRHYARALARLIEEPAQPPQAGSVIGADGFDRTVLAELHRYLPSASCAAIVVQFHTSAEQLLAEIDTARDRQDWPRLAHAAHSLIGTAGAVGMAALAAEARRIVTDLREDRATEAARAAGRLRPLYDVGTCALDRAVADLERPGV